MKRTVSYLIGVLVPGEDLQFITKSDDRFVLGGEFSQASSWPELEEAKACRDAFMDQFRAQGYRTALGDPEDPASKAVMFTIMRSTIEPVLTAVLLKD